MIVLRCSQKLLKRLHQPAKPPEPLAPSDNPLGEWCADIDFIDRQPFALLMNAATGAVLVLPARAGDLKHLNAMAAKQLAALFDVLGLRGALAQAELDAWSTPPTCTANQNRSLVAAMNQRKFEAWTHFAYHGAGAFKVALHTLEMPFRRKDLGREYCFAADLLRQRLAPSAKIISFKSARGLH